MSEEWAQELKALPFFSKVSIKQVPDFFLEKRKNGLALEIKEQNCNSHKRKTKV